MKHLTAALLASLLLAAPLSASALDADFNVLLQNELREVSESAANPGNRVARLPSRLHQAELRAELKQSVSILDLTARPRLEGNYAEVNGSSKTSANAFFQEVFLRANLHESLSVSVGRIQFGWGPAESVTPTNWLAPEIQWQASPYYEQLGYYRAQANITLGQGFSLVLASELQPLDDRWESRDTPEEVFRKRSLAKVEWNWDNANKVIGFVGGQERRGSGELWRTGAYGSWTVSDAWQLYFDGVAREQSGGGAWKPFAVAGVRYSFESGAEFHAEGIHNGTGYSREERRAAEAGLSRLGELTLREMLLERGTSLLSRDYAYLSFGWPNPTFFPAWVQTPVLHVRSLHSLTDHSTSLLGATEIGFRDLYTVALYAAVGFGPKGSEMRQLYDGLFGVVGKVSF